MQKLVEKLESEDPFARYAAVCDLRDEAGRGRNIAEAVPKLLEIMQNEGERLASDKTAAVEALTANYAYQGRGEALVKLLEEIEGKPHQRKQWMKKALNALQYFIEDSERTLPSGVVAVLGRMVAEGICLEDREDHHTTATWILLQLAKLDGRSIAPAIPHLKEMLEQERGMWGEDYNSNSLKAMARYAAAIESIELATETIRLSRLNEAQVKFIARELGKGIAKSGNPDRTGLDFLMRFLALPETREDMKLILGTVGGVAGNLHSLEALEELDRFLEVGYLEWQTARAQRTNPKKLRADINIRNEFAEVAREIAERKAELAREKDDQLLAGETIPKPRNRRGAYREVRGVGHA